MTAKKTEPVFQLASPFRDPVRNRMFRLMRRSIERAFLLDQLNRVYEAAAEPGGGDFLERTMRVLDVRCEVAAEDQARVPVTGPTVVVANHPFGGIEGVVLVNLLRQIRPDVKIMANYLLARMPEMHPFAIFVDPFGRSSSPRANLAPLKACIQWVREGHMLVVFPAGEVSHLNLQRRRIIDSPWSHTIARIIRRTEAPALPVFIEGRNSALFQMMGLVHPRVRTALLPRELIRKRGACLRFRIGNAIPHARMKAITEDEELMRYLRLRTYLLRSRSEEPGRPGRRTARRPAPLPVAEPLYPEALAQDILMLPPEAQLIETEDYAVFAVTAGEVPRLLHEIGRLREITFRAAGEGTGKPLDLDRFDEYYTHLILWHRGRQELAGAYRIGKTDRILVKHGKRGLYTSTLFRYQRRLLEAMGPSLELGRSFVRPEYQRQYAALLLLWKGIGRMILREPHYRTLFGPVSINNEYRTVSRQMLVAFLRANKFNTEWARHVRARHPPRRRPGRAPDTALLARMVRSPEEVSDLIAEVEADRKGVPVLLKQYLKLGGRLLSFNVDPEFSDVLDGLISVDLLGIDERILIRFLGRAEAEGYLAHHGRTLGGREGSGT